MSEPPNGGETPFVRVTNKEVWMQLRTVEAKLDDALRTISSQNERLIDHGKRIRGLELRFYGVLAGLVGAVVVLVRFVSP